MEGIDIISNAKWSLQNRTTYSYDPQGQLIDTHQELNRPEAFTSLYYGTKLSDSLQLLNREIFEFEYASNSCSYIDQHITKVEGNYITMLSSICNITGDLFSEYVILPKS
jgi:hypothetical protein